MLSTTVLIIELLIKFFVLLASIFTSYQTFKIAATKATKARSSTRK
jgi:hypothetical protein